MSDFITFNAEVVQPAIENGCSSDFIKFNAEVVQPAIENDCSCKKLVSNLFKGARKFIAKAAPKIDALPIVVSPCEETIYALSISDMGTGKHLYSLKSRQVLGPNAGMEIVEVLPYINNSDPAQRPGVMFLGDGTYALAGEISDLYPPERVLCRLDVVNPVFTKEDAMVFFQSMMSPIYRAYPRDQNGGVPAPSAG